jgi:hypothetical protein
MFTYAMTEAWLGVLVLGLLVVSPLLVWLSARRLTSAGERPYRRDVLPAAYEGAVEGMLRRRPNQCPECGATNDPGFRYCHRCQADLE